MVATVCFRKFKLQKSEVRKRGKIGLKQSLIYINPCSPLSTKFFFYFPSLHFSNQKKELLYGRKIFGEAFSPPTNYADVNGTSKQVPPFPLSSDDVDSSRL